MDSSNSTNSPEQRLDSWKEIAAYLDRGVRTVQRWERTEGLPVRRHQHDKRGTVFALPSEIDEWQRRREAAGQPARPEEAAPRRSRRVVMLIAACAAGALAAGYSLRAPRGPAYDWTMRPVTSDHGHEHAPTISPDGTQIAYVWHAEHSDPAQIYVQDLSGGERRRLASGEQSEYSPAWSPDGSAIAAAFAYSDGRREIVLVTPETGACRTLLEVTTGIGNPMMAWSPDGEWLALAVGVDDRGPGMFAYRLADGELHELLAPRGDTFAWAPDVSPDGRRLAFAGTTSNAVSQLFVLALDEGFRAIGEPYQVTSGGGSISRPMWTEDGRELLYRGGWWADSGLWRIPVDGGEPRRAAVATRGLSEAAYRPEHGLLLYTHETGAADLWLQPPCDCLEEARRLISSTLHDFNARFSPDGERIAWISDRTGRFQVWTAQADGSEARALTEFGDTMTGTPRWSPDSRLIAFDSRPDGHSDIFIVSSDGGAAQRFAQRFTENPAADLTPNFSSDGEAVYFGSDRSGEFQIWRKPLAGGEAEQVTQGGGFTAIESPDGETLYFARSGNKSRRGTSLWKMPVGGGDEVQVAEQLADWSKFVVREGGVYFVACDEEDREKCDMLAYRPESGETERIGRVPRDVEIGVDVAPDGSLLYARYEPTPGDLMLVEGFR